MVADPSSIGQPAASGGSPLTVAKPTPSPSAHDIERRLAEKLSETSNTLTELRSGLPMPEDRLVGADGLKAQANEQLKSGHNEVAMRLYLTALWLLKSDEPAAPAALLCKELPKGCSLLPALDECATASVHSGSPAVTLAIEGSAEDSALPATECEHEYAEKVVTLRRTLLLNVAACAIKRDDWLVAQEASERVLEGEPTNVKALYRLAQAHEGRAELRAAASVLSTRLLKSHPNHAEASRLLTAVRRRMSDEKRMFHGLFERAVGEGAEGDGLYSEAALREEARAREAERDRLLRVENLAKLPSDMWREQLGQIPAEKLGRMVSESQELTQHLPDTAWQKHVLNMTPAQLDQAKEVRRLIEEEREQEQQPQQLQRGVRPVKASAAAGEDGVDDDPGDPGDALEEWLDSWLTTIVAILMVAVVAIVLGLRAI